MRFQRTNWMAASLLLCLLSPTVVSAAKQELAQGEVLLERLSPAADWQRAARQRADQVLQRLAADDANGALAHLKSETSPLIHDQAVSWVLEALAQDRSSASGRAFVAEIATTSPKVWRRHEETRADWFEPMFNLPEQAAAIPALWRAAERRAFWRSALDSDAESALSALFGAGKEDAGENDLAAAAAIIAEIDPASLTRVEQAMLIEAKRVAAEPLPATLALAVAQRRPSEALLRPVLDAADPAQMIAVLRVLAAWPDPAAERMLIELERQPAWSSAATLALLPKWFDDPQKLPEIARRLADPERRASTASAIARRPSAAAIGLIERLQAKGQRGSISDGLLLSLDLLGSAEAREKAQQLRAAGSEEHQP